MLLSIHWLFLAWVWNYSFFCLYVLQQQERIKRCLYRGTSNFCGRICFRLFGCCWPVSSTWLWWRFRWLHFRWVWRRWWIVRWRWSWQLFVLARWLGFDSNLNFFNCRISSFDWSICCYAWMESMKCFLFSLTSSKSSSTTGCIGASVWEAVATAGCWTILIL